MLVLKKLECGILCWGMHAAFRRTAIFLAILAVGAICEIKFISLNFTLYKCEMILSKKNTHQIVKPQKFQL